MLPRPQRPGGPPILVGGNGMRRSLPMAARYAAEWNGVFLTPERFRRRSARLDELLAQYGRQPAEVRRSVMIGCVFGRDEAQLARKVQQRGGGKYDQQGLRQRGLVVGTGPQLVEQLGALAEAGVQRVMLQWLDLDDLDGLEALAQELLPHFPS